MRTFAWLQGFCFNGELMSLQTMLLHFYAINVDSGNLLRKKQHELVSLIEE